MAFAKKTWKDRIAEFPTRRRLTKEDNTSELVTVAREEGTLSQEGDAFSAENMNDLENRIDAEFTAVNGNLTVRYNPDTDMVQIYYNGTWNDWKNAGLIVLELIKSGVIADGYSLLGTTITRAGWTNAKGQVPTITKDGTTQNITVSNSSATVSGSAYISPSIDLTGYKKISITIPSVSITTGANTSFSILLQKNMSQGFAVEKTFSGTPTATTSTATTVSMNVTDLTGNYTILINYYVNAGKPLTVKISDITIE